MPPGWFGKALPRRWHLEDLKKRKEAAREESLGEAQSGQRVCSENRKLFFVDLV